MICFGRPELELTASFALNLLNLLYSIECFIRVYSQFDSTKPNHENLKKSQKNIKNSISFCRTFRSESKSIETNRIRVRIKFESFTVTGHQIFFFRALFKLQYQKIRISSQKIRNELERNLYMYVFLYAVKLSNLNEISKQIELNRTNSSSTRRTVPESFPNFLIIFVFFYVRYGSIVPNRSTEDNSS